jgi:hypothetical protein
LLSQLHAVEELPLFFSDDQCFRQLRAGLGAL